MMTVSFCVYFQCLLAVSTFRCILQAVYIVRADVRECLESGQCLGVAAAADVAAAGAAAAAVADAAPAAATVTVGVIRVVDWHQVG